MTEFRLKSSEGLGIYGADWQVEKPRAIIALVHGVGEHVGRYHHFADYFNKNEIGVVGIDLLGHGKSEGKRGHTASYAALMDQVDLLLNYIAKNYAGQLIILYGHSGGGNLVLNHLLKRDSPVIGVVATGPWIRLAFQPPAFKIWLAELMTKIAPGFRMPNGLKTSDLSTDPAVVAAYDNDPLVHDLMSAELGWGMLSTARFLDEFSGQLEKPLLLMHGGADRITSAKATMEFASRLKGKFEVIIWDGLYHEIHNEPTQNQVFAITLNWINRHITH